MADALILLAATVPAGTVLAVWIHLTDNSTSTAKHSRSTR